MATHLLKSWPQFFAAVVEGRKKFEVRRDDRNFRVGDTLLLQEFIPETREWTQREYPVKVSYIIAGDQKCAVSKEAIKKGFCVMGIEPFTLTDFLMTAKGFLTEQYGEETPGTYPELDTLFAFIEAGAGDKER